MANYGNQDPKGFLKLMLDVDITEQQAESALLYRRLESYFFHYIPTIDYLAMFKHTILTQRSEMRDKLFIQSLLDNDKRPLAHIWWRNHHEKVGITATSIGEVINI